MDSNQSPKDTERPSWLTEDYITEVLREGEKDPGIVVNNFDINNFLAKGENYQSVIKKATVRYIDGKEQQKEKTLIIKIIPDNPMLQHFARESNIFNKEINAYSKLIPAMAKLTEGPLFSAKYYPTDRDDVVILEDMSSHGFRMADRKKRLDLAHSSLVLKTLGRFHGLSFAVTEREPSIVDVFPESMNSNGMKEFYSSNFTNMNNALVSLVETWPGFERFSEKIRSRGDGIMERMEEMISPNKNIFNVLNHGDVWVNNILFRYNQDTQEPEEVCLLDLQAVRYGSPALDLQYFFATSLADNVREEHEDILLEQYHTALLDTLSSVALKPITYSLEDLRQDFQEKAEFGFNVGCFVIGAVVADSSEAIDLDTMTEESLEDGSANPMEKVFQGKRFKDVLQKHLLYCELKGVI